MGKGFIVAAAAAGAIGALYAGSRWLGAAHPSHVLTRLDAAGSISIECGARLTRETLEESLRLGVSYLAAEQYPAGNFVYEYDWVNRRIVSGDDQVRQAGAAWSAALGYQHDPRPENRRTIETALEFFDRISHTTPKGGRYIVYPGEPTGSLGAIALLTLAEIEYLRVPREGATPNTGDAGSPRLDGYVRFLLDARAPDNSFMSDYHEDGTPFGEPSPYSDGEALLALAKASRYLGRDLGAALVEGAAAARERYVVQARRKQPDSDATKGFYQWGSMAFFELHSTGRPEFDSYARTVIELGDWILDTHRLLTRDRNTGYAIEGLVHAALLAREVRDEVHTTKFACAVNAELSKLTSWQVGGPMANEYIKGQPSPEQRAVGGVQNAWNDPVLRIDVTQHQMHAVMLAIEYLYQ